MQLTWEGVPATPHRQGSGLDHVHDSGTIVRIEPLPHIIVYRRPDLESAKQSPQ